MATSILIRMPLLSSTNNSISPPPSPPRSLSKAGRADSADPSRVGLPPSLPPLRRKGTIKDLINLDSSESDPSRHSSLYEASIDPCHAFGDIADEDAWVHNNDIAETSPRANTVCSTNGDLVPGSFLEPITPPKLHTPHKLYPITEQPSFATLHPFHQSSSVNHRPSNLTLRSRRSRSPGLHGMRQKSFSLSDLPSWSSTGLLPAAEPSPPASSRPVPKPNLPLHPPPVRSSTPPNLPRFGTPEACNYRLPRPAQISDDGNDDSDYNKTKKKKKKKEKRRKARLPSSTPEVREWRRQTVGLPKNVIMRGDDGTLVKGKFIPAQSGHNAPVRKADHGGPGNGQGHVPHTPYILPDVRPVQYSDHGTRATWTDAVMTGGIGAGPGADSRYTVSMLRAQRDREDGERRKRRSEGFEAWKVFWGVNTRGHRSGDCCSCSRRMWWCCCPCFEHAEADAGAGPIPLQNGV